MDIDKALQARLARDDALNKRLSDAMYADEPGTFLYERAMTRDERRKIWEVSVSAAMAVGVEARPEVPEDFSAWTTPSAPHPDDAPSRQRVGYRLRRSLLNFVASRRFDKAWLAFLTLYLVLFPATVDKLGKPALKKAHLLLPLAGMVVTPAIPVVAAAFIKLFGGTRFMRGRGSDEPRFWSVLFIMSLRAFSNPVTFTVTVRGKAYTLSLPPRCCGPAGDEDAGAGWFDDDELADAKKDAGWDAMFKGAALGAAAKRRVRGAKVAGEEGDGGDGGDAPPAAGGSDDDGEPDAQAAEAAVAMGGLMKSLDATSPLNKAKSRWASLKSAVDGGETHFLASTGGLSSPLKDSPKKVAAPPKKKGWANVKGSLKTKKYAQVSPAVDGDDGESPGATGAAEQAAAAFGGAAAPDAAASDAAVPGAAPEAAAPDAAASDAAPDTAASGAADAAPPDATAVTIEETKEGSDALPAAAAVDSTTAVVTMEESEPAPASDAAAAPAPAEPAVAGDSSDAPAAPTTPRTEAAGAAPAGDESAPAAAAATDTDTDAPTATDAPAPHLVSPKAKADAEAAAAAEAEAEAAAAAPAQQTEAERQRALKAKYLETFSLFDQDGGGDIDVDELGSAFEHLGFTLTEDELEELLESADADGSGTLDFEEFCGMMEDVIAVSDAHGKPSEAQMEEFRAAFAVFDGDDSGSIEAEELGAVLKALGVNPTQAQLDNMMLEADEDGSGEIDFDEFVTLVNKLMQAASASAQAGEAAEMERLKAEALQAEQDAIPAENRANWRCRTCGRNVFAARQIEEMQSVDIVIRRRGVGKAKYVAEFLDRQYTPKCRVCGTPANYRPKASTEDLFLKQKGDVVFADKKIKKRHGVFKAKGTGRTKKKKKSPFDHAKKPKDAAAAAPSGGPADGDVDGGAGDEAGADGEGGGRVPLERGPSAAGGLTAGMLDDDDDEDDDDDDDDGDDDDDDEAGGEGSDNGGGTEGEGGGGGDEDEDEDEDDSDSDDGPVRRGSTDHLVAGSTAAQADADRFLEGIRAQIAADNKLTLWNVIKKTRKFYKRTRRALLGMLGLLPPPVDPSKLLFNDYTLKERMKEFLPELPRREPPNPKLGEVYRVGEAIEANWHMPHYYPASVVRVHPNLTYDIRYDNGEVVNCVEDIHMRYRVTRGVSVLQQFYSLQLVALVVGWPAVAFIYHLMPRGPGRDVFICLPMFFAATLSLIALVMQVAVIYIQGGNIAGCVFLCRLTTFFALPAIFLWWFAVLVIAKLDGGPDELSDDPEAEESMAWSRVMIPSALFSLAVSLQAYMMKPMFGTAIFWASLPFIVFQTLLAQMLDGAFVPPSAYIVFAPLYVTLGVTFAGHNLLPYVWDATY